MSAPASASSSTPGIPSRLLSLVLVLAMLIHPVKPSSFGINYGQVANNLPSPTTVPSLVRTLGVSRIKLYDSDPGVLRAFASTGVDVTIGIPDKCIPKLASDPSEATIWAKCNLLPYLPSTKISTVTVGNEVLTGNDTSHLAPYLLPAMRNLRAALTSLGIDPTRVSITTPHSLAILSKPSYPPSSASFRKDLAPYLSQILDFSCETGSPFLINAYPYFAYKDDPHRVSLDYVLFQPNQGLTDPASGLCYKNMLHAQVDAVYAAMDALVGKDKAKAVTVRVSETGWPSRGDEDEAGATPENAKRYNGNLMKLVEEKKGTPRRPDQALDVYVFALFNENLKPGPESERNYGLFKPDGTPVYQFWSSNGNGNGNGNGSSVTHSPSGFGGGGNGGGLGGDGNNFDSNSGYYTISGAGKVANLCRTSFSMLLPVVTALWATAAWPGVPAN